MSAEEYYLFSGSKNIKLERVVRNGLYFSKFIKGESAFLDYYRFLRGEDITPLLQQSRKYGSNCRRNFFMTKYTGIAGGIGPCNPDDFGNDWFDKLPSFLDLYQSFGVHLYASIFPDNHIVGDWGDNIPKQRNHWGKIGEIAKSHNAFFAMELGNEIKLHSFNNVDPTQFSPIPGVLCCSGSYGDNKGIAYPDPQWDFVDHHTRRSYPQMVVDESKANHPSRLLKKKAVFSGEPVGFGNKTENKNRIEDPAIAKEIAGSARGTCAGIIYHSTHGALSQLYDIIEQACALAWFKELVGTD